MKPVVVEDVHNTTYRTLTRAVLTNFSLHNKSIPFAVAFDATILHFKPWSSIVFDPSNTSEWKNVLTKYYASDGYKQLNEITAGDALMAKYATIRWLNALSTPREGQYYPTDTEKNFERHLEHLSEDYVVGTLTREAKEIAMELQVAKGFTHAGIPYSRLLNEPEKFRRMARDKIIVEFLALLKDSKKQQPNTKRATSPTNLGGLPLSVKRIERWRELFSVLPAELALEDVLDYKIASRTLRVTERKGGFPDYVVYLDKSGSMSESISYNDGRSVRHVPKISFAAAATLALQRRLSKLKAKLTIKPFDVEVHDAITDNLEIVDFLMKIRADNGTNVTKVLDDAYRNHRDEKVVIISDGIDQVNEEIARKCKKAGIDVKVVFIKTDNEVLRRYFDCVHLREARPSVLLTI